jgi:signal transduction histidine kinase
VTLLGELAASIAHELNQPLTAIASNAEAGAMLVDSPSENAAEIRAVLEDIIAARMRASEIIGRMRTFLRKGVPMVQSLDLNQLIADVCLLMRPSALLASVKVRLDLAVHLPPVVGDRVQIQQVLLNLMHNAAEAMLANESLAREVHVSTRVAENNVVCVSVRDTGPGIADTDLERIFEAFFTTKSSGIGMGLHLSRSIIAAHGGRIWARGAPAGGATFCFTLPVATAAAAAVGIT